MRISVSEGAREKKPDTVAARARPLLTGCTGGQWWASDTGGSAALCAAGRVKREMQDFWGHWEKSHFFLFSTNMHLPPRR
jgi:hypothetical protein